ncbi:hypothetical protein HanRHA438_Chr12g0567391 [Helianthus annuus]|nr:hypothetical protein HanRHA438_Chr12g0567391 [Helianthus annuus]
MMCISVMWWKWWNILVSRYPTVLSLLIGWIHMLSKQSVLGLEGYRVKWSNDRINGCNMLNWVVNRDISNQRGINKRWINNRIISYQRNITNRWVSQNGLNRNVSMYQVMLMHRIESSCLLWGQGRLWVIKSHVKIKLRIKGIDRINGINRVLHMLVHRNILNIAVRIKSWGKNGIRILNVVVLEHKARDGCGRRCLIGVRVMHKMLRAHLVRRYRCHRLKGVWDWRMGGRVLNRSTSNHQKIASGKRGCIRNLILVRLVLKEINVAVSLGVG